MGRVLLIGNDPALAGALRASHHLAAHQVEMCAGPFQAAQMVRSRGYDVAVTDRTTPPDEDLALVRAISARSVRGSAPSSSRRRCRRPT